LKNKTREQQMKGFLIPLSAVLALLISIVRLLLVANYQTTTAVAIASGAGPLPTLIGSLLPVIQVFLPILTVILLVFSLFGIKSSSGPKVFILAICSLVATFFITPTELALNDFVPHATVWRDQIWPYVSIFLTIIAWCFTAALLIFLIVVAIRIDWKSWRTWQLKNLHDWDDAEWVGAGVLALPFLGTIAAVVVLLLGLGAAVLISWVTFFPLETEVARIPDRARSMWLPAEEIGMKSNGDVQVGYVLGLGNGWMTLLTEPDRTVSMVPLSEVSTRHICRYTPPNSMPLIPLPGASIPIIRECVK
jgi:hypothetical protein